MPATTTVVESFLRRQDVLEARRRTYELVNQAREAAETRKMVTKDLERVLKEFIAT